MSGWSFLGGKGRWWSFQIDIFAYKPARHASSILADHVGAEGDPSENFADSPHFQVKPLREPNCDTTMTQRHDNPNKINFFEKPPFMGH